MEAANRLDEPEKQPNLEKEETNEKDEKLYTRRFFIIGFLILAIFANGEAWMTFVSVEEESMRYFNISEDQVYWFGSVFFIMYALEAIPCMFLPKILGIRWTLLTGLIINFVGTWIRFLGIAINFNNRFYSYLISLFGNAIFGLGQGFQLNMPSQVSAAWFGRRERSIATAAGYFSDAAGIGVGFFDIFLVMPTNATDAQIKESFMKIISFEILINTLGLVLGYFIIRSIPKNPPTRSQQKKLSAENEKVNTLDSIKKAFQSMWKLISQWHSCVLLYAFSCNYGSYCAIFIYLSELVDQFSEENVHHLSGYVGSAGVIVGGIMTIIVGIVMDKTKNRMNRKIGFGSLILCAFPLVLTIILKYTDTLSQAKMCCLMFMYLMLCPIYVSVGTEILADNTFPIDPNISANVALIFGNIFGAILTHSLANVNKSIKYHLALGISSLLYISSAALLFFIKFDKTRNRIDHDW